MGWLRMFSHHYNMCNFPKSREISGVENIVVEVILEVNSYVWRDVIGTERILRVTSPSSLIEVKLMCSHTIYLRYTYLC